MLDSLGWLLVHHDRVSGKHFENEYELSIPTKEGIFFENPINIELYYQDEICSVGQDLTYFRKVIKVVGKRSLGSLGLSVRMVSAEWIFNKLYI